jgi:phosphoadenosine phosphosulfate reductase
MQDIYRNGTFEADIWESLAADAPFPETGHVIVAKARLLATDLAAVAPGVAVGVLIEAGEGLENLEPLPSRLALIAVNFPKFNDGRGFSLARLLRDRYGYRGPLRAVGDVLIDLMHHMERVGFSEFKVTNEPTRRRLANGPLPEMPYYYQPAWSGDTDEVPVPAGRPWLRRAV